MTKSASKPTAAARRAGVQSIDVGSRLLEVLAAHMGSMHLRDIAAAANMSASKAHRYLISLLRVGLAEQDPISGRYGLGTMALRIGLAALSRSKVMQYATRAAIEFNQTEDLTVALSVWGEHGPTVVGWYDSSQILICNVNVGSVLPVLRSAAGQIFLAYLPRAATRRLVDHETSMILTYLRAESFRSKSDIDALIQKVRTERLGVTHGDLMPGLSAIAAPVFDHQGQVTASLSLIGPSGLMHSADSNSISQKLLRMADSVSLRMGRDPALLNDSFIEMIERGEYGNSDAADAPPPDTGDEASAAPAAPKASVGKRSAATAAKKTTRRAST